MDRFINNKYCDCYEATIGAGFFEKQINMEKLAYKLSIWDTAGQERFASIAPFYYRGAQAAIVVFDVAKKQTFERAKIWITDLNGNAPASIIITLIGNKCELEHREIMTDVRYFSLIITGSCKLRK